MKVSRRTSEYEHILKGEYINSPTSISRLTALSKMKWWYTFKWVSSFWSRWRTRHRKRLDQLDIFTFTQCSYTILSRKLDYRPLLSITSVYSSKVERLHFQYNLREFQDYTFSTSLRQNTRAIRLLSRHEVEWWEKRKRRCRSSRRPTTYNSRYYHSIGAQKASIYSLSFPSSNDRYFTTHIHERVTQAIVLFGVHVRIRQCSGNYFLS